LSSSVLADREAERLQ